MQGCAGSDAKVLIVHFMLWVEGFYLGSEKMFDQFSDENEHVAARAGSQSERA